MLPADGGWCALLPTISVPAPAQTCIWMQKTQIFLSVQIFLVFRFNLLALNMI